jgi:hypothetical protein
MPAEESREPWYTYFFGVRGFLRLYPIAVGFGFFGFVIYVTELFPTHESLPSRLLGSSRFALQDWRLILILAFVLAFMVWVCAVHGAPGLRKEFSDECKDYDWWGRRLPEAGRCHPSAERCGG